MCPDFDGNGADYFSDFRRALRELEKEQNAAKQKCFAAFRLSKKRFYNKSWGQAMSLAPTFIIEPFCFHSVLESLNEADHKGAQDRYRFRAGGAVLRRKQKL